MNHDKLKILLLRPDLKEIDPGLPGLVWEAYHGDDDAMLELARVLLRAGRSGQARRVLDILERTRQEPDSRPRRE
jgi:hypothetical protein